MTQEFVTLPRDVVEQALESLKNSTIQKRDILSMHKKGLTIDAIRAALEQQPTTEKSLAVEKQLVGVVGWRNHIPNSVTVVHWTGLIPPVGTELYIGQQPQVEQEPVAWIENIGGGIGYNLHREAARKLPDGVRFDLYTHQQPNREPLSLEQIAEVFGWKPGYLPTPEQVHDARAIEAAHNIK